MKVAVGEVVQGPHPLFRALKISDFLKGGGTHQKTVGRGYITGAKILLPRDPAKFSVSRVL